ncbi:MAG: hypothetical protein ACYCUM_09985 [Solirubrobacteraceae bacterium]
MPDEVTWMIASVGSWILGSGTSCTCASLLPCHVSALEAATFVRQVAATQAVGRQTLSLDRVARATLDAAPQHRS